MVTKVVGAWPEPDEVFITLTSDNKLTLKDNSITIDKLSSDAVPKLLYIDTSRTGTTVTGSWVTLKSYTLPANTAKKFIIISASGNLLLEDNSSGSVRIRVEYDTTVKQYDEIQSRNNSSDRIGAPYAHCIILDSTEVDFTKDITIYVDILQYGASTSTGEHSDCTFFAILGL